MIAASRPVLIAALAIALIAHGLGLHGSFDDEAVEIAGSTGGAQSVSGYSFADMTQGVETPVDAEETPQPSTETDDVTDPLEPVQTVEDVDPPDETAQEQPTEEVAQEEPTETEVTQTQEVVEDVPVEDALEPELTPLAVETVVPILPVEPVEAEPVEAARPEPIETLEAQEDNTSAVARSLRPKPRTPEFEKRHEPPPPPEPQPTPQPTQRVQQPTPQTQGDANQNANRGGATGTQQRTNSNTTGTGTTSQAGNAAITNYPGQVMRRINRVRKPRVGFQGTAVVAFRVSASGGLAGVSLSRSSGNQKLDQAALNIIRRAAPFPPPPPGADRSFAISIEIR